MENNKTNFSSRLLWLWQIPCILFLVYLVFMAFMEYNWYPNPQSANYNIILGVVFFSNVVLRLMRPVITTVLILSILDFILLTFASRAIINHHFWGSLFSFISAGPGFIAMLVFGIDYYVRLSNFSKTKALASKHRKQ